MEARLSHTALFVAALCSLGASYRTQNFVVRAATPELAREIANQAETLRSELAKEWTGSPLPQAERPCVIETEIRWDLPPSGLTQAKFGYQGLSHAHIYLQGSRDRVLRSVLPHELTHLVFASVFGASMPRWADEGASITVEHEGEQADQHRILLTIADRGELVSLTRLFSIHEYPANSTVIYTQGFSLTQYLVQLGGRQKFTQYLTDGLKWNDWDRATEKHYSLKGLRELEQKWTTWALASRPLEKKDSLPATPAGAPESPLSYVSQTVAPTSAP